MKESDKIKFWLGVSVATFIGFRILDHHLKKTGKTERAIGTTESRMLSPESIVDVRAAPGVARVTL